MCASPVVNNEQSSPVLWVVLALRSFGLGEDVNSVEADVAICNLSEAA